MAWRTWTVMRRDLDHDVRVADCGSQEGATTKLCESQRTRPEEAHWIDIRIDHAAPLPEARVLRATGEVAAAPVDRELEARPGLRTVWRATFDRTTWWFSFVVITIAAAAGVSVMTAAHVTVSAAFALVTAAAALVWAASLGRTQIMLARGTITRCMIAHDPDRNRFVWTFEGDDVRVDVKRGARVDPPREVLVLSLPPTWPLLPEVIGVTATGDGGLAWTRRSRLLPQLAPIVWLVATTIAAILA